MLCMMAHEDKLSDKCFTTLVDTGDAVELTISSAKDGAFDLIYTDDGVGIPLEKMQATGDTLGVSLIEGLVEQLNGRMTVEGTSKGTNYHIRFTALER